MLIIAVVATQWFIGRPLMTITITLPETAMIVFWKMLSFLMILGRARLKPSLGIHKVIVLRPGRQIMRFTSIRPIEIMTSCGVLGAGAVIQSVAWNHDGKRLAAFTVDGVLTIWNTDDGDANEWHQQAKMDVHSNIGVCDGDQTIDWHPDENWVVVGCPHALFIWDVEEDIWSAEEFPSGNVIETLAWSNTHPAY